MNTTKGTGEFKVPPKTREPWDRILNGRGSIEDLQAVVGFLAKAWQYDSADPRSLESWLAEQGLSREGLSPLILADRKAAYALDLKAKTAPTKEMVSALVNGRYASDFFASIGTFSSDFRILAYHTAVSGYLNEGIAFALTALSQESQWLIDEAVKSFRDTPILNVFKSFTVLRSTRVCLGLMEGRSIVPCDNLAAIDLLFCLATNPPKAISPELERLRDGRAATLVQLGETLLTALPERGFGQFAKVNVSLFICNAAPKSRLFEAAKQLLVSTGEPAVADFLGLLGPEHVRSEVSNARSANQSGRERYVAAVIDAWRKVCGDSILEFEQETSSIESKAPVIAVALSAGTVLNSPQHEKRFARLLERGLRATKDQSVREWLVRNPEFIKYLPMGQASLQTVKTILDVARSVPTQALAVSSQLLGELRQTTPLAYWEEAIRTLAATGGGESDRIFRDFVTERLRTGESTYIRELLGREPAASLFRRNFIPLIDSAAEQGWSTLFEFLGRRNAEATLIEIVESVFPRAQRLGDWIVGTLIPGLLETDSLSPEFHRAMTNVDMTAAIAKTLSSRVLADIEDLRAFKDTWPQRRSEIRMRLLPHIQAGLRIALNTTVLDTRLHAQLSKALNLAQEWAAAPPPAVDPVIVTAASAEPPSALPDEDALRGFFAHRAPSAMEFTLTAAKNPWCIDVILRQERGPWPKGEVLVGQIINRYINVSQIRRRSQQQLESLGNTVRAELAVALREIVSNIESELAGYFAFRDILDQNGLHPVMDKLGAVIQQRDLSSERHKVVRDPGVRGRMRVFGLGIQVDDRVVSSGLVMNSGDNDDRD